MKEKMKVANTGKTLQKFSPFHLSSDVQYWEDLISHKTHYLTAAGLQETYSLDDGSAFFSSFSFSLADFSSVAFSSVIFPSF